MRTRVDYHVYDRQGRVVFKRWLYSLNRAKWINGVAEYYYCRPGHGGVCYMRDWDYRPGGGRMVTKSRLSSGWLPR